MKKQYTQREWSEFQLIKRRFPQAKIKKDYNREILDIGVEIPTELGDWTLLKGEQTKQYYELVSPEYNWFEHLETLDQVHTILYTCREKS